MLYEKEATDLIVNEFLLKGKYYNNRVARKISRKKNTIYKQYTNGWRNNRRNFIYYIIPRRYAIQTNKYRSPFALKVALPPVW